MMELVRVFNEHWHAVQRDLLTMGLHVDDLGTPKLSIWELISVIVAAPDGTAVFRAKRGGWSPSEELLANLGEQRAGLLDLKSRYPRPGVPFFQPQRMAVNERPFEGVRLDVMTVDQLVLKRAEHLERGHA